MLFWCCILSHVMFQEDNKITEELLCPFFCLEPHLMLAIYVRFAPLQKFYSQNFWKKSFVYL